MKKVQWNIPSKSELKSKEAFQEFFVIALLDLQERVNELVQTFNELYGSSDEEREERAKPNRSARAEEVIRVD